jgi:hypothetical protein
LFGCLWVVVLLFGSGVMVSCVDCGGADHGCSIRCVWRYIAGCGVCVGGGGVGAERNVRVRACDVMADGLTCAPGAVRKFCLVCIMR